MDTVWLLISQLVLLHLLRLRWLPQVAWRLGFWVENQPRHFILRLSRGSAVGNTTRMANWEPINTWFSPHDRYLGNIQDNSKKERTISTLKESKCFLEIYYVGCLNEKKTERKNAKCKLLNDLTCSVVSNSFDTPWTVAHQAPLSMGSSQQEYWSVGYHFLLQGNFSTQGLNSCISCFAGQFFTSEPLKKPCKC